MFKNIKSGTTLLLLSKTIILLLIIGVIIGVFSLIIMLILSIIGSFRLPEIGLTYKTISSFYSLPIKVNQGLEGGETFGGLSDIKTFDVNSLTLSELKINGLFLGNTNIKTFENNLLLSSFNKKVFEDFLEDKKWYKKEDGDNVTYVIIDNKKMPFVLYANPTGKIKNIMKNIYFSKDLFFLSKVNTNIDAYYFIFRKNSKDFNYPYIMNYGIILQQPPEDNISKEKIDQKIIFLNEMKEEIGKSLTGITTEDIDKEIKKLEDLKKIKNINLNTSGNISNIKFDTSILFDLLSVGGEIISIPLFDGKGIEVVETQTISCKKEKRKVVVGSLLEGEKKFSFKSEKLKGKEKEFESLYDIRYKTVKVCGGDYIGEIFLNKKGFDNSSFENISTFDKTYLTLNNKEEFSGKVRGINKFFFLEKVDDLTSENITYSLERSVEFMNSYFYKGSISPGEYFSKNDNLSNDKYIFSGTNGQLSLDINPILLIHSFIQTYKNENKEFTDLFKIEGFLTTDNGMNISKYLLRYGENVLPIIFDLNKSFNPYIDGDDFFYSIRKNKDDIYNVINKNKKESNILNIFSNKKKEIINRGLEKINCRVDGWINGNICEQNTFRYNIINVILGINTFGQKEGKYNLLTTIFPKDYSWFGFFSSKDNSINPQNSQIPITITNGLGYNKYIENSYTKFSNGNDRTNESIFSGGFSLESKDVERIFKNVEGFGNNPYFVEKLNLLNENNIYLPSFLEENKKKVEEEKKKYQEFYSNAIKFENVKTLFTGSGFYSFTTLENDKFLDIVKEFGFKKLLSCQSGSTSIDIEKIDLIKQNILSNVYQQINEDYSKKVENFIDSLKNNYYPCTYIKLREITNSPFVNEDNLLDFEMPEDGLRITTRFANYQLSKINLFVDTSISKLKEIEDEYNRKIQYIEISDNKKEKKKIENIKKTIDIIKDMISVSGINSGESNILVVLSDLQIYSKLLKEFSKKENQILNEPVKLNTIIIPYKVYDKYEESNNTRNIIINLINEKKKEKELLDKINTTENNSTLQEELKKVRNRINFLLEDNYSEYLKSKENDENKEVIINENDIKNYIKAKIKEQKFNQYIVTQNPDLFESISDKFYDLWTKNGNKDYILYYNLHVFYKGLMDLKVELDKNQDVFSMKRYGLSELDKGFGTFGKYYFSSYNEGKIILENPEILQIFGVDTSFDTTFNDSLVNLEENFKNKIKLLNHDSPEIFSLFQSGGIYQDIFSSKDNTFHKMLTSSGVIQYLQERYPEKLSLYNEVYSDLYNNSITDENEKRRLKMNYYYSVVDILKTLYIDKYASFNETLLLEFVLPPDSLLMIKYKEYKQKKEEIILSMSSLIDYSSSIQKKQFNITIDSWKSNCTLLPLEEDRIICNGYINYLKSKKTMKSFLQEMEYAKSVVYLVKGYEGHFPKTSQTNVGKNFYIQIEPYRSTNGGLIGQCVWYISVRKNIPQQGNAKDWGETDRSKNIIAKRGGKIIYPGKDSESIQKIKKGDILTYNLGSFGHIVIVEKLDTLKREITISENNYGITGITTIRTIPFDSITGRFITNIKDKYTY